MKLKFTMLVSLILPVLVHTQAFQIDKPALPIDSLKKVLPLLRDSARIDCLNELARSYTEKMELRFTDSALATARQEYKEASAINYTKGLGDASLRLGVIYSWLFYNLEEREKYYREAISWHQKIQNDNGLGFGFWGLGGALLDKGAIDEANKTYERSAFHFKKAGNEIMLADLMDCFGNVYGAKGDFEKQFKYIKKGLREKKRIGDSRGMAWSFYSLAHIYRNAGDYETALDFFRQSIQQARQQSISMNPWRSMGNIFREMRNYDSSIYYFQKMLQSLPYDGPALAGLGKLFMLRKEYDTALSYLRNAIVTFKKRKDEGGMIGAMVDMGKSYAGLKQYPKALLYAKESLTIAERMNLKEVMKNAYEIYWNVYEALHQKDSAYFYFRNFITLKDSLDNAKYDRQYLQKLALYKVEAKEEQQQARIDLLNKDNQLKQQQLQEESLHKKVLIGSLFVLVVLSIIIFRNIALKRKNEKHQRELVENELQIQKLESEKTKAELQQQATELEMQALRSQMNPHFIFNCLNSINRFILKNETESASDYLTRFSRLIRMVLNNSKHKYITLNEELDCLELYIQMEQLRFKNAFRYQIKCGAGIDGEEIMLPPLLIQPFVENAIWHGLMRKDDGEAKLDILLQLKENVIRCIVTDNGIGRKTASESGNTSVSKYKSMGLQITRDRIALLDVNQEECFIHIEDLYNENGKAAGTKVTLRIRCDKAETALEIPGV